MNREEYTSESKFAECKPLLDACTPLVYRQNAFRITGLPPDALPRDIKRRTDDLKAAEEMGEGEEEHSHAFALDPPPSLDLIREAAIRLHDPERRIIEEFFWFWPIDRGNGKHDSALVALANGDKDGAFKTWWVQAFSDGHSTTSVVAKHNLAVMYHLVALDSEHVSLESDLSPDSLERIGNYWRACFDWWEELTDDEIFWSIVTDRIRMLDDPRLTTGFGRRMRATLPEALDKINAILALQFAEKGKLDLAHKHIVFMKETHQELDDVPKTLAMITSPLQTRIRDAIEKTKRIADQQSEMAAQAAHDLFETVSQPIEIIKTILPPDDHDRIDLCDAVAGTLMQCAVIYGYETEEWEPCISLLQTGLEIVASAELKEQVEKNLLTVRQNAEHQQLFEVCWFCKKNKAEDNAKLDVPMYGDVQRKWSFGGTHVTFRKLHAPVPRCSTCKSAHSCSGNAAWLMAIIGAIIGSFPLPIVGTAIGGFIGWGIGAMIGNAMRPSGIASEAAKADYPPIKELRSQGWEFGEQPS